MLEGGEKDNEFDMEWNFYNCKSYTATAIFQGMTPEEFEDNGVKIHEIDEHSMIRKRKIAEPHDQYMELV